uniref:Uncharacterized protein n=1 Tax=Oryza punctata TaxID=4537 RepID=A0A0E0K2Z4_ORYPU
MEGRRIDVAEATCYRCWVSGIRVGGRRTTAAGVEGPRRKASPVFHWVDSSYSFGRNNPLGGVIELISPLAKKERESIKASVTNHNKRLLGPNNTLVSSNTPGGERVAGREDGNGTAARRRRLPEEEEE